jgi:AcrR family transcriptional regulator
MATRDLSPGRGGGRRLPGDAKTGAAPAALQHQRARLLAAMVEIVSDGGYARTSIGELARRAGVSRGTFYELFADKESCFLSAFEEDAERLKHEFAAQEAGWTGPGLEEAVATLLAYAAEHPRCFDFLFHEALLAGPEAFRARDDLGWWVLGRVRDREERCRGQFGALDAAPELMLGAVLRLVTMQMRRGDLNVETLGPELRTWMSSYRADTDAPHWGELAPVAELMRSPGEGREGDAVRRSAPKGRHGLSAEALRALQRERIAYGTAAAIHEKGYAEATVSDIVAASGVSRDVFYSEFRDKHEAFNEAAKLVFEQLLARMASAYYGSAAPWPRRVWEAGEAFASFLEGYPVLAHFLFVGTSAPHPQVDTVNEYVLAFKVFVEDGFTHGAHAQEVPPVTSEALVCAVVAVVTYRIREDRIYEIRGLIPAIVFAVIAPFVGRDEAAAFIDGQVAEALSGR